jgi:hypothetical protein
MKISTIFIICLFSISYLFAEEYKNISYDWSQIVLPKNDKPLMSLITEKNELLIVGDSALYYSNDYGKSLKAFPGGTVFFQIFGYQYDKDNGIYLIIDGNSGNEIYVPIYYLNPSRDSLISVTQDFGNNSHIYKKYNDEHNLSYYTLFTDIISDQYLLIGTHAEVWLYDIINKKYSSIKYIDDLIQDLIQKDSISLFTINLVNVNQLSKRIDIYYSVGTPDYHIYSNDLGKTWKNDLFQRNCIPYPGDIILGYAQWNKKDRWYIPIILTNTIESIDNNCNIFYKEFSFKTGIGIFYYMTQYNFYAVDSLVIFPSFDHKLLLSKDYGHNYDTIDNIPVAVDNIQFLVTQVFTDSKVLILSWNKDKTSAVYVGTPKPTSVDSEIENNDLVIYPNPARDYIEIHSSEGSIIQIFNTLGENVLTVVQTSSSVQRLDISNLSLGMYFIKIGNRVEKFVKM